ncbi:hypothetical protein BZA05DRAFT_241000 [Tricharina praecox]|uniref:uncharacterized protein n=1 Tax=Tricharina praecox TaxID=43433 RepID=UPI00221FB22C|nr:uncharacterized protein BZA05DRAFT_241000 [Tricharina praecox]KAI5855489.1 hypothetical protein BZA05DRAFT_241000 [Tricharina praecox]
MLPSNASSDACVISSNADVAGVGVRISVYCPTGITILCDAVDATDLHASFARSLGLTGLAILSTAVVQTWQRRLSLFHSLILVHYLALIIPPFFCSCVWQPVSRHVRYWYVAFTFTAEAWMVYVSAEKYAYAHDCDVAMVIQASTGGTLKKDVGPTFAVALLAATVLQLSAMLGFDLGMHMIGYVEAEIPPAAQRVKSQWMRVGALVMAAAEWVAFVVFTEELLVTNRLEGKEGEWSYGQMLSVSMLLVPVQDCLCILIVRRQQQQQLWGF